MRKRGIIGCPLSAKKHRVTHPDKKRESIFGRMVCQMIARLLCPMAAFSPCALRLCVFHFSADHGHFHGDILNLIRVYPPRVFAQHNQVRQFPWLDRALEIFFK